MRKSFHPWRRLPHPFVREDCQQLGVGQAMGFPAIPYLTFYRFSRLRVRGMGSSMHPAMYACTWVNKSFCWPLSGGLFVWPANFATFVSIHQILSAVFVRTAIDEA